MIPKSPKKISEFLEKYEIQNDKYVSQEFQQYGYDLAVELGDMAHKALYIRLAKTQPRAHLEGARRFVKDADNAKSKGRLFMWKLGELKKKAKEIEKEKLSRR